MTRRAYREETFVNDGWKDKLIWVGLCAVSLFFWSVKSCSFTVVIPSPY